MIFFFFFNNLARKNLFNGFHDKNWRKLRLNDDDKNGKCGGKNKINWTTFDSVEVVNHTEWRSAVFGVFKRWYTFTSSARTTKNRLDLPHSAKPETIGTHTRSLITNHQQIFLPPSSQGIFKIDGCTRAAQIVS